MLGRQHAQQIELFRGESERLARDSRLVVQHVHNQGAAAYFRRLAFGAARPPQDGFDSRDEARVG